MADPFDAPGPILVGERLLDSSTRRAVVDIGGGHYANIFHDGRFWKGFFDPESVRDVVAQRVPYSETRPGFHWQWRFLFHSDRLPVVQSQSGEPAEIELEDLIFSAEPTFGIGQREELSLVDALFGTHGLVLRAVSGETKSRSLVRRRSHAIHQFRLNLDMETKRRLLKASFSLSARLGYDEKFHPLWNNSRTLFLDILDSFQVPILGFAPMDLFPLLALWPRGVLKADLPTYQQEIFGRKWTAPCPARVLANAEF